MKLLLLSEEAHTGLREVLDWINAEGKYGDPTGKDPEEVEAIVEDVVAIAEALEEEIEHALTVYEPVGVLAMDDRPAEDGDGDVSMVQVMFHPAMQAPGEDTNPVEYMKQTPEPHRAIMWAAEQVAAALESVHGPGGGMRAD